MRKAAEALVIVLAALMAMVLSLLDRDANGRVRSSIRASVKKDVMPAETAFRN
jgi:hypothetical protein